LAAEWKLYSIHKKPVPNPYTWKGQLKQLCELLEMTLLDYEELPWESQKRFRLEC